MQGHAHTTIFATYVPESRPLSVLALDSLSRKVRRVPSEHGKSDKGPGPENVETLIYMRFRGRPHSHKTPRTFHAPSSVLGGGGGRD